MSTLRVNNITARTGSGNVALPAGNRLVGAESGALVAPGMVLQAVYATSGFVNQTINSATPVALTGMTVTITPRFATSRILLQAMVAASWSYVSSVHVFRNGVNVIPNHGGNNQSGGANALWTHYQSSQEGDRGNQVFPFPVIYQESPGVTSALTYTLRANSGWGGGSEVFYFNNRNSQDMLGSSTMVVMEIAQ